MSAKTFDEVLEEIKNSGEKEKESIEVASELARIIGDLAEARVKRGFTQRELADVSGIKQAAIARMESLQAIPRLDTMVKLARFLDVKINVEASSSASIGVVVSLLDYEQKRENRKYMWVKGHQKTNSFRKEGTYAAIG